MEWISVEDRLPELDDSDQYEEFITYCSYDGCPAPVVTCLDWTENGWFNFEVNAIWNQFVTHWMPLPEPPCS